jgi:hypothetical protein
VHENLIASELIIDLGLGPCSLNMTSAQVLIINSAIDRERDQLRSRVNLRHSNHSGVKQVMSGVWPGNA